MSVHCFVRFEPRPGKESALREELLSVIGPTRDEGGCLGIQVFESLREPWVFEIHSEWADEAAFELHARTPHTVRFVDAAEKLLTHFVSALRTRQISGAEAGSGHQRAGAASH